MVGAEEVQTDSTLTPTRNVIDAGEWDICRATAGHSHVPFAMIYPIEPLIAHVCRKEDGPSEQQTLELRFPESL